MKVTSSLQSDARAWPRIVTTSNPRARRADLRCT